MGEDKPRPPAYILIRANKHIAISIKAVPRPKPFSKTDDYLVEYNKKPIDWL